MAQVTKLSPKEILELAMEREKGGQQFYAQAAATTQDAKGKQMFEWLAREELSHLKHLEEMRQALGGRGKRGKRLAISEPLSKGEFPSFPSGGAPVKPDTRELEALRLGIEAEKADINFYAQAAQTATDPDSRELFQKLVQVEQGHLELLEEEYDWLRKSRAYFTIHRFALRGPE